MSITITVTGGPQYIRAALQDLLNGPAPAAPADASANVASGMSDAPSQVVVEPPAAVEPEVIPPVRKPRTTKKADTTIQPDVADAEVVEADPFAGMKPEEKSDIIKKAMVLVMDSKGEDRVLAMLAEHKVKNRSEAVASSGYAEILGAFMSEGGTTLDEVKTAVAKGVTIDELRAALANESAGMA